MVVGRCNQSVVTDFARDTFCLFGLVFDRSSTEKTIGWVRGVGRAAQTSGRSVGLNWVSMDLTRLMAVQTHENLRAALLKSDHCTIGSRWILRLANKLALHPGTRVSQSQVVSGLSAGPLSTDPLGSVVVAADGAIADRVTTTMSKDGSGLEVLDVITPGYLPLAQLNHQGWMDTINQSQPDVMSVSLGETKGQIWLATQKHRLRCGVSFVFDDRWVCDEDVKSRLARWFRQPMAMIQASKEGRFYVSVVRQYYRQWPLLDTAYLCRSKGDWKRRTIDGMCEVTLPTHVGDKLVASGRRFWPEVLASESVQRITINCLECQSMSSEAMAQLLLLAKHAGQRFLDVELVHVNPTLLAQFKVNDLLASLSALNVHVD